MSLEETVDDDRLPFVDRYRQALGQTVSEDEFSAQAIQTIAEDWGADDSNERVQGVMFNLLDTIEDSAHENEVDFRLASSDVDMSGEALGDDPFEEQRSNRYVIKGMLGSGGMGQVFEVLDTSFDRSIAVKFLHPKAAAVPKKMNDFFREARLTARLEHPNIFPVHDVNISDGGMPYFSMRKASGDSLHELIETSRPPHDIQEPIESYSDRANIIIKVCDAVAYAHSQGIIHQDIKPSNIMIGEYGEVIVVDWGTARNILEEDESKGRPKMQGTPIYMSPEQARREFATTLSDVYCIGATLFHLLTFRYPTWSDDPDAFWEIKKQGLISMPTEEEQRQIPGALLSIALKAMAPDPNDRYQTVMEMRTDLLNFQRGLKVRAHRDSLLDVLERTYRLNKRAVWAALMASIIVLSLAYMVYLEIMKSQSEWQLVKTYDFSATTLADLETDWNGYRFYFFNQETVEPIALNIDSPWSIKDGKLFAESPDDPNNYNVSYGHHIAGDIRVEWDYTPVKGTNSLNCFIGGPTRFDGYQFHLGGNPAGEYKYVTKQEQFVEQNENWSYEEGVSYHYRLEKEGQFIRLYINEELNFEIRDIDVLSGPGHQTFGFETLRGAQSIDNIKIYSRPLPEKISPIMVANSLFANQRYGDAVDHYQDIQRAYPDSDLDALATFRKGRSLAALGQHDEALAAFNDFRHRFPDHYMTGYVLRDIGLSYVSKNNWELAAQYFDQIADQYKDDASLCRSAYQAIENATWDIIDMHGRHYLLEDNVMEKVNRVEYLVNHWSERLGVSMAKFNNIRSRLPFAMIAFGEFNRVLRDYLDPEWPWPVHDVCYVTGQFEKGLEFADSDSRRKFYMRLLGRDEEIQERWGESNRTKALRFLRNGEIEEARALYPDPQHSFYADVCLAQADYDAVLEKFPELDSQVRSALFGLGRYEEFIKRYQSEPGREYDVERAMILAGREQEVLSNKDRAFSENHIKALASLLLKAHVAGDEKSYLEYRALLEQKDFFIERRHVDHASFEKFILLPFLEFLRGNTDYMKEAFTAFHNDPVRSRLLIPSVCVNLLEGAAVDEVNVHVFRNLEISPLLFRAMHAEIADDRPRALELYRQALDDLLPHNRTIPAMFMEYRLKALR